MNSERGRLITFEGGDGCGKSTQLKLTAGFLKSKGRQVLTTREPGDTPLGAELRKILLDGEFRPVPECELLLFLADRAQHVRELIRPALDAGTWVLCDRYSDSTMAYQLAGRKLGGLDGLAELLAFAEVGVTPDLTFWLDLPVSEALHRMRNRTAMGEESTRLDEEALSFHQKVYDAFGKLHAAHDRMTCIDAAQSIELIQQRIQSVLGERGMA